MKNVLLTRPATFSENLSAILEEIGYATIVEPILTIEPRNTPRPDMDPPDAIMLTSRFAIGMLQDMKAKTDDLLDLPCFCIGIRTAEAARSYGFRQVFEGRGDSVALARKITQVIPPLKTVLHIVGEDKSTAVGEYLIRAGFTVVSWTVYKAVATEALSLGLQAALSKKQVGPVLFFSPRTASTFADLVRKHGLESACADLAAIGLSRGIIATLGDLRFASTHVADEPTEASVIACLQTVYPASAA